MRHSRLLAPALAPLLATTLFLGACNSDDDGDTKDDKSSSTSESPSESASESEATESEATDEGSESTDAGEVTGTGNTAVADDAGVQFDLPEGWQVIDPSNVSANDKAADLAEKLGITVEQFEQQLASLDVWAQNSDGENLNTLVPPLPSLPTEDQLTQQFATLGFTVTSTENVSTPVGDGVRVAYDLGSSAGTNTAGAGLFVEVDGKIANISVTATSPESAAEVLDLVISTLATN